MPANGRLLLFEVVVPDDNVPCFPSTGHRKLVVGFHLESIVPTPSPMCLVEGRLLVQIK